MAKKKKTANPDVFTYLTRIKVVLGIITFLLAALLPVSWLDKENAWVNGVPLIFIALIPIVLYFIWVLWQDGKQKVTVSKDSLKWEKGRWIFKKEVEIPFAEVASFRDNTTIFSISRKYTILSNDDEPKKIFLSSSVGNYRKMLERIIPRLPKGTINERAKKSLQRARIKAY